MFLLVLKLVVMLVFPGNLFHKLSVAFARAFIYLSAVARIQEMKLLQEKRTAGSTGLPSK